MFVIDINGNIAFPSRYNYLDGKFVNCYKTRNGKTKGKWWFTLESWNLRQSLSLDGMIADLLKNEGVYNKKYLLEKFPPKYLKKAPYGKDRNERWEKRGVKPQGKEANVSLWMYGVIKSINDNQSITVVVPTQNIDDYPGVKYWQDPKAKLSGRPENVLPIVKEWINGTEENRTYIFKTDETTDVFLNGIEKDAAVLKVGDKVGVHYYTFQEENKLIYPEIVRVFR